MRKKHVEIKFKHVEMKIKHIEMKFMSDKRSKML